MDSEMTTTSAATSLPPGPSGLPVVGSALEYKGPQTNLKWAELYGPIYHVRMGDKSLVYLNTIELVEKYMEGRSGEQFLGRPMGPAAFGEGLLFGSGDLWKSNKRAFMRAMRTETLLEDMETAVQTELTFLIEDLRSKTDGDRPIRIGDALLPACANAVSSFMLGGPLPRDGPERKSLHKVVKNLEGVNLNSALIQLSLKYPRLGKCLRKYIFKDIIDVHGTSRRLQRLIRQWIRQIRSTEDQAAYFHSHHAGECPSGLHAASGKTNTDVKTTIMEGLKDMFPTNQTTDFEDSSAGIEMGLLKHSEAPKIKLPSESEDVATSHKGLSGNNHSPETEEKQLGKKSEPNRLVLNALKVPTNLVRMFVSTESLLTVPKDSAKAETSLQNQGHYTAFGFVPVASGEQPIHSAEPENSTETSVDGLQWRLEDRMSLNHRRDSFLQRVLAQPEFLGVSDDDDTELLQSLVDMFFGGVTTVVSGLEFVLMYLSQNPTMQLQAQQEIARVLKEEAEKSSDSVADTDTGIDDARSRGGGKVTWSMREKMPYVRACVVEALRLGGVTPSSLPHVATVDTEIEGFAIPKNTFVLASIYSLHRDPTEYIDAHTYRPQRHLDASGNFRLPRSYKPYGIGARYCVGEALAERELFIFTAAILNEFDVISPAGSKPAAEMDTHMRVVHRLIDFECVLKRRT